jgi:iron complex outermembrane recepter protein
VALLKKILLNLSVFGSVSTGFSPPTVAEVRPSAGSFNADLQPEKGTSYELGFRGNALKGKLNFDVTAYFFQLSQTIVVRRTADGADFFTNTGNTDQKGLEGTFSFFPLGNTGSFVNYLKLWTSLTYQDYRFRNYLKNQTDLSGNWLTGVPPGIIVAGVDGATRAGVYMNLTFNFTDRIPLDDAGFAFASGYHLLTSRLGWRKKVSKLDFDIFLAADNLLDETYSLGNDLNATGGRYFNPAARQNFSSGLRVGF